MTELLLIIFYGLMLFLWVLVLIDIIKNAKNLPLRPVYRYILIMIPFIGPFIYFSTKKRRGNISSSFQIRNKNE
ncbi:MAG: hypothetical protein RQ875_12315 [Vicingaceae bacterium]|nr:hypothetical protein [Vicingaceae bacterium]